MYVIDRIENDIAVVYDDNNTKIEISTSDIIGTPKDGDIIYKENNFWLIDKKATAQRLETMKNRLNNLFNRNK